MLTCPSLEEPIDDTASKLGSIHWTRNGVSRLTYAWAVVVAVALAALPVSAQAPCAASPKIEASLSRTPSAENYNAKGEYLARHDDLDCAVPAFRKAIELDGEDWRPRFNLALAHLKRRRLDDALPHLTKTVALRAVPRMPRRGGAS